MTHVFGGKLSLNPTCCMGKTIQGGIYNGDNMNKSPTSDVISLASVQRGQHTGSVIPPQSLATN